MGVFSFDNGVADTATNMSAETYSLRKQLADSERLFREYEARKQRAREYVVVEEVPVTFEESVSDKKKRSVTTVAARVSQRQKLLRDRELLRRANRKSSIVLNRLRETPSVPRQELMQLCNNNIACLNKVMQILSDRGHIVRVRNGVYTYVGERIGMYKDSVSKAINDYPMQIKRVGGAYKYEHDGFDLFMQTLKNKSVSKESSNV